MGGACLTKAYIAGLDGHFECYNASCTPDGRGLVVTRRKMCSRAGERLTRSSAAVAVRFFPPG